MSAACSGGGRSFSGAARAALADVIDGAELQVAVDRTAQYARIASEKQSDRPGDGDTWSELSRTFCALAEVKAVLLGEDTTELIRDALACHPGYAGFRAPACLTLAESIEICGVDPSLRERSLQQAHKAALSILNPRFCVQTLSRVSALDREWWSLVEE